MCRVIGKKRGNALNYLVLDLEMCKVPREYQSRGYLCPMEIIQIGAVLLDESFRNMEEISLYVHPEHGVIDRFIANLTGIQRRQVKESKRLREALLELEQKVSEKGEYKIYTWSGSDYSQLRRELDLKEISEEAIERFMEQERWVDYQKIFGERYRLGRKVSLEEALSLCGITPDGKAHNGLDDSINTGYIIEKLEKDPDFQLIHYDGKEKLDSEPMRFGLGSLLAGIQLDDKG